MSVAHSPQPSLDPEATSDVAPRLDRLGTLASAWSVLADCASADTAEAIGASGKALSTHLTTIAEYSTPDRS